MKSRRRVTMVVLLGASYLVCGYCVPQAKAADHREAPLIEEFTSADLTDIYAFAGPPAVSDGGEMFTMVLMNLTQNEQQVGWYRVSRGPEILGPNILLPPDGAGGSLGVFDIAEVPGAGPLVVGNSGPAPVYWGAKGDPVSLLPQVGAVQAGDLTSVALLGNRLAGNVVRATGSSGGFLFDLTDESITPLTDFPNVPQDAFIASSTPDGTIVGGNFFDQATGNQTPFVFHDDGADGRFHLVDLPAGVENAQLTDISPGDEPFVVGGMFLDGSFSAQEAFKAPLNPGQAAGLGDLQGGAFHSVAEAVSADGRITVGCSDAGVPTAFIHDDVNGMRSLEEVLTTEYGLDLTGWQLASATDISADGLVIVGQGTNSAGRQVNWVATMPEPAALTILGAAVPILLARRRITSHRKR